MNFPPTSLFIHPFPFRRSASLTFCLLLFTPPSSLHLFLQSALAHLIGVRIIEASVWMDALVNIQRGLELKWGLAYLRNLTRERRWKLSEAKKLWNTTDNSNLLHVNFAQQANYSQTLILFSFFTFSSDFCRALLPSPSLHHYFFSCFFFPLSFKLYFMCLRWVCSLILYGVSKVHLALSSHSST